MSKKLIAVAAAAALALTGLVATPANATTISSVTVAHSGSIPGAQLSSHVDSDSAIQATTWASARNVVFGNATDNATRTAVRFEVLTAGATTVTVTAKDGVRIAATITSGGNPIKVDAGSTTLTGATTAGSSASLTYTFFAWNTSSAAGSVVIETPGSRNTYFVKGTVGPAYNITNVTWPASLYKGQTDGKVTFNLTDAYGNSTAATGPALTPTGFGASWNAATYSTVTKLWTTAIGAVTADNVAINLSLPAFDGVDYTTNGFAKRVDAAFKLVSAGDLTVQVANLTKQVTDLQAQLAALTASTVTKAKYNKLVRKWNRANPSNKVKRVN
jgi:hypothetical protein